MCSYDSDKRKKKPLVTTDAVVGREGNTGNDTHGHSLSFQQHTLQNLTGIFRTKIQTKFATYMYQAVDDRENVSGVEATLGAATAFLVDMVIFRKEVLLCFHSEEEDHISNDSDNVKNQTFLLTGV